MTTMPMNLVFMLEEPSAKYFLDKLLSRSGLLPQNVSFQCIPHQGRSDLQKSIPRKLAVPWPPNTFFVILHDQDSHDCKMLKQALIKLCASSQHTPLIRIVCRELESWYCGDLAAVASTFPGFNAARYENRSRFRNPDEIENPNLELQKIVKDFNKGLAAQEIPKYMNLSNNRSHSFNCTIKGIRDLIQNHAQTPEN